MLRKKPRKLITRGKWIITEYEPMSTVHKLKDIYMKNLFYDLINFCLHFLFLLSFGWISVIGNTEILDIIMLHNGEKNHECLMQIIMHNVGVQSVWYKTNPVKPAKIHLVRKQN